MANTTFPKLPGRVKLVVIDEITESKIFERQPDLFWKDNPETTVEDVNAQINEHKKQDLLSMAVQETIAGLPEIHQKIIYLRYFDDGADAYSAQKIADKLGIPKRTYYHYLNHAKKELHFLLKNQLIVIEYLKKHYKHEFLNSD